MARIQRKMLFSNDQLIEFSEWFTMMKRAVIVNTFWPELVHWDILNDKMNAMWHMT